MELRPRAKARVHKAHVVEPPHRVGIQIDPIGLIIWALIPVKAQPTQIVHEQRVPRTTAGPVVQVLDAQHKLAALAANRQPRQQGRKDVSQVHAARGGWSKPPNDRSRCAANRGAGSNRNIHRAYDVGVAGAVAGHTHGIHATGGAIEPLESTPHVAGTGADRAGRTCRAYAHGSRSKRGSGSGRRSEYGS